MAEGAIDETHAFAGAAHHFGRRRVLGNFGPEGADAAGALEVGAAPQHRLALGETETDGIGRILPARLVGVEEGAFHLGPEAVRQAADGRGAQQAGVGAPAGQQALQVVARHQHVAVGHHHPGMRGGAPALDEIVQLGIGRKRIAADEQLGVDVRILGDEAADHRHDGIVGVIAAQDQLIALVGQLEAGAQRQLVIGVEAAHRP